LKKQLFLAGFTLVEIMISVAILGFGLTIVANSYIVALKGSNAARNNIRALVLAKEKLEALESSSLNEGLDVAVSEEVLASPAKNYNYLQDIVEIDQPEDFDYLEYEFQKKENLVYKYLTQNFKKEK